MEEGAGNCAGGMNVEEGAGNCERGGREVVGRSDCADREVVGRYRRERGANLMGRWALVAGRVEILGRVMNTAKG